MYTVKIEITRNESEIIGIPRPNEVELIINNDEFLNATGNLSEIVISLVFEAITNGIFEKVGEKIFDYIKKIILKNNSSKNKSGIKIQIETKDVRLNFSGKNLNSQPLKTRQDFGC